MKSDYIPYANGVDDEFIHKNILELLIKDKIMAIKKSNNASNRTLKNLFKRSRSRTETPPDNNHHALTHDEKKLNIAIVELPKNNYYNIQNYAFDEPVIIDIEDPIFTLQDGGLDSISLYNIEITGDPLIDYNIDTTVNNSEDVFKLKSSILDQYSSDNQSVSSSYTNLPSNRSNTKKAKGAAQKSIQNFETVIQTRNDFTIDYSFESSSQYRKHSLETFPKRSSQSFSFKDSSGINLDDHRFVKLCLSDSDISKTSNFLTRTQSAIPEDCQVPLAKHSKKPKKRHNKQRKRQRRGRTLEEVMGMEVVESDDLPERARWTIIFTAVLLLVMCLFLVGITLRMAPLIDDIVRQENERLKIQSMKVHNRGNLTLLAHISTNSNSSLPLH